MRHRQANKNRKTVIRAERAMAVIASGANACSEGIRAAMLRMLEAADKRKQAP
ncbi:MAG: hypothetical protein V3U60_16085 [Gammaproteobacteria bacterium]